MSSLDTKRAAVAALETNGVTTAERLFEAARDPNHPLHDDFVWDGNEAIYQLGIERARAIIREVRVIITHHNIPLVVPEYIRDPMCESDTQGYINVATLANDQDRAMLALKREIDAIEASVTRGLGIAISLNLENEFEQMLATIAQLRAKAGFAPRKPKHAPRGHGRQISPPTM